MDIQSIKNLQNLIDKNPNILLIEIWDRVLYLRMKVGRNVFHTKKKITNLKSGIYLSLINFKDNYKNAQRKFHPDRNEKYIKVSQGINKWKEFLSECFKREFSRTEYNTIIATYSNQPSIFSIVESIRASLGQETGLFYGLSSIPQPTDEQRAESQRWWEEELARQSGRNKDGSRYKNPYDGDIPW